MASEMFLYWGSGSIPCWRAMLVLEEKGLQGYPNKLISFSAQEHKSDEVLKLNPRGQVPTFRDGDVVVNESTAICEYLEFKFADQGTCLLPKDPAQRGPVLQKVFESQNLMKALIENIVYYIFRTKPEDIDKEVLDGKKKEAKGELQRWDDYLKQQGDGAYIVGNSFTMADVFVYPIVAFGVRGKLNLEAFPALNDYYNRLSERESVKATWPPHWKEEPGKDFFEGL